MAHQPDEGCLEQLGLSPKATEPDHELLTRLDLNKFRATYVQFCQIEGGLAVDQEKAGRVSAEIWVRFRCRSGDFSAADTDLVGRHRRLQLLAISCNQGAGEGTTLPDT